MNTTTQGNQAPKAGTRVVIVGGGYAGSTLAQRLDADYDVTLIEKKDRFFHNVAALRAAVDQRWVPSLFLPYDTLLRRGRVQRDTVVEVRPDAVVTASGALVPFDYLALATGVKYPLPGRTPFDDSVLAQQWFVQLGQQIAASRSVLLIGGGAVGVELAGEIASQYPAASVTLVHSGSALIGTHVNPQLSALLLRQLRDRGVRVLLDERVALDAAQGQADLVTGSAITTTSGQQLAADLIVRSFGNIPNSQPLLPHFAPQLDQQGRLNVNAYLQVVGYDHIFALGDLTAVAEPKMAYAAEAHAAVVAANINILHGHRRNDTPPRLRSYTPPRPGAMIVPLGPHDGAVQLPFGRRGLVLGGWAARQLKGKTLLVERYRKLFGVHDGVYA